MVLEGTLCTSTEFGYVVLSLLSISLRWISVLPPFYFYLLFFPCLVMLKPSMLWTHMQRYMDSEIRAIMAQYMPLDNQGEAPNHIPHGGGTSESGATLCWKAVKGKEKKNDIWLRVCISLPKLANVPRLFISHWEYVVVAFLSVYVYALVFYLPLVYWLAINNFSLCINSGLPIRIVAEFLLM